MASAEWPIGRRLCAQFCRWMLVKLALLVALMSGPSTSEPRVASADELLDAKAAVDVAVERLER